MDIQNDKDFAALPEVAKLYQACKERDLTIAEREYLKGARDAWQAKAQSVPEGFVLVSKDTLNKSLNPNDYDEAVCSANELLAVIEAQEKNQ